MANHNTVYQLLLATLVSVAVLSLTANAFNLENRLPINKFGAAGSYFGYSVAEHVVTDSEDIKWWVELVAGKNSTRHLEVSEVTWVQFYHLLHIHNDCDEFALR